MQPQHRGCSELSRAADVHESGAGRAVQHLGILAFVRTHYGIVRYFMYVADVDSAVRFLNAGTDLLEGCEFSAAECDNWKEYTDAVAALQRT